MTTIRFHDALRRAALAVLAWADSLADYPVADDMDYSQEQMMED